MKLFKIKKKNILYTVITGHSRIASAIADMLSEQGHSVLLVADCSDMEAFNEADIHNADVVIVASDDDNLNMLVTQFMREVFTVMRVIAIINNSEKECVYRELGITAVNPAFIFVKDFVGQLFSEKKDD